MIGDVARDIGKIVTNISRRVLNGFANVYHTVAITRHGYGEDGFFFMPTVLES